MATRRYEINKGETEFQITEAVGAAVATKNIELTVDLGATPAVTKEDVLLALEKFENHILKGNWPPA